MVRWWIEQEEEARTDGNVESSAAIVLARSVLQQRAERRPEEGTTFIAEDTLS